MAISELVGISPGSHWSQTGSEGPQELGAMGNRQGCKEPSVGGLWEPVSGEGDKKAAWRKQELWGRR